MKHIDFKNNEWHSIQDIDELISIIKQCATCPDFTWSWSRDFSLKYISVKIDMRDGGFLILDREGTRIDLDRIKNGGLANEDKDKI